MPYPENKDDNEIHTPSTTTSDPTPSEAPHPTMELTIEEFPTLPTKPKNITISHEQEDFSDNLMDQSPAVTSNRPIQTKFKRPHENTSKSEDHSTLTSLTREQQNSVIHV